VAIDELIQAANKSGKKLNRELLQQIVDTNEKKRFTISDDGLRIRAAQGHSTSAVNIDFPQKMPPEFLYHGTATRFVDSIKQQGLIPGQRHHVHLSHSIETATEVGKRYGKPHIFVINAKAMVDAGFVFYCSDNNVWLVDKVPAEYLID
jgi:putative RNA 2'-phosphotransferase